MKSNPDPGHEGTLAVIERMMRAGWIPRMTHDANEAVLDTTPRGLESIQSLQRLFTELGSDLTADDLTYLYGIVMSIRKE